MLYKFISFAVIIAIILSGCSAPVENAKAEMTSETAGTVIVSSPPPATEPTKPTQKEAIEEKEYILPDLSYVANTEIFENIDEAREIDITIKYPQISGLDDEKKQRLINELVKESAMEPYYYFQERDLTSDPCEAPFNKTSWPVEYKIVYASEDIFSIVFKGYAMTRGSAHGTNLVYAVNIDLKTGERITIDELFDNSFEEKLNMETFDMNILGEKISKEDMSDDANEMLEETIFNYKGNFINSHDNFYFGWDKFLIILPVMNDHHSFEASYDDLRDVMNMENPIWDRILVAE